MLPVARRAIAFLEGRTDPDGLFREEEDRRTDLTMVANWSPLDPAAGVDSFTNAVHYDALRGLAALERDVAGDQEAPERWSTRAEQVRRALLNRLWDEAAGAMVLNSDDPTGDHTGDTNAGNLVLGTLDRTRARRVMDFLGTSLATPYGTRSSELEDNPYRASDIQGYIQSLEALGRMRHGDAEGALGLVRRWWGHMLDEGPGTGWFSWNTDGTRDADTFAATPWTTAVPALSEGVLGARPTAPGYRRRVVAPRTADLEWTQGRVPTPDGGLAVRWERGTESFVLTVAPSGGEGEVVVPLSGRSRRVAMDGRVVWEHGRPADGVDAGTRGDGVVFRGIRGTHTFAWTGAAGG